MPQSIENISVQTLHNIEYKDAHLGVRFCRTSVLLRKLILHVLHAAHRELQ
jgi:hypothetical protein